MALLTNTTATKTSPSAKTTSSATMVGKKTLMTLKKSTDKDNVLDKKPSTVSSPLKSKTVLSPSKPALKVEKSPLKISSSKATNPVSTMKTPSPIIKKSVGLGTSPSSASTAKTPVREKSLKSDAVAKSVMLKTPERKQLPEIKKEPARSAVLSSPKSKPVSPKSSSLSLAKNILSPIKSVSSSPKSSLMRRTPEPVKEMKLGLAAKTKKPIASSAKPSTIKVTKPSSPAKVDPKLKTIVKKPISSSPKISKSGLTIKIAPLKIDAVVETPCGAIEELVTPEVACKIDLCQCSDITVIDDNFNHRPPLIAECDVNNEINLAQVFKVAEQLIRIRGVDEPSERIEEKCENSTINWEDIITPCDADTTNIVRESSPISEFEKATEIVENENFSVSSSDDLSLICNENHTTNDDFTDNTTYSLQCDSSTNSSNIAAQDVQLLKFSSAIEIVQNEDSSNCNDNVSSTSDDLNETINCSSESTGIFVGSDVEYSTPDSNCDSIGSQQNNFIPYDSPDEEQSSTNVDTNMQTEWTIIIDEFSLDMGKEEKRSQIVDECETTGAVLSYADVLKKSPKVLANSTNSQNHRSHDKPKFNITMQIKEYQMLKKVEAFYSTNIFFNNDTSYRANAENYYDNFEFDEPEFRISRKKNNSKKLKYFSKRHFKNACRNYEYIAEEPDVFITPVWKNIY